MAKRIIYFMEKNIHGAWVVYGVAGIKQYYYYTKKKKQGRSTLMIVMCFLKIEDKGVKYV